MFEDLPHRLHRTSTQLQLRQSPLNIPGDLPDQAAVGRELVVIAQEALGLGAILKSVEQYRLAHPAQAPDNHALLCGTTLQATNEHSELLELRAATRKLGGREPAFGV